MNYKEIFQKYQNNELSINETEDLLFKIITEYDKQRNFTDAEKARICLTFINREKQFYNKNISKYDFLLFIRNFILFVGQFKPSEKIKNLINSSNNDYSFIEEANGNINVYKNYPSWITNIKLVDDVYLFGSNYENNDSFCYCDNLLKKNLIYNNYKSFEQKIAAHTAMRLPNNYTMIISLPTGGGKSLITQLLATTEEKMTLVIVPTVALGLDQLNQAKNAILNQDIKNGVFCYQSQIGEQNLSKLLFYIRNKTAKLVFTSPEAVLKNKDFLEVLENSVKNGFVHNIVIDETHMITDWGVSFRTEFQLFSVLLSSWRKKSNDYLRVYLLSATLSDEVVDTLKGLFVIGNNFIEYRCDSLRKEPRFLFANCNSRKQRDNRLVEAVKALPKPLIIYTIRPDEAVKYEELLHSEGFKNVFSYTGETESSKRKQLLDLWKKDKIDIMVATSAFGIGVDKRNVRTVIHACMPENLSRFYQEVGRGGRDGLPSLSLLMPFLGRKYGLREDKGDINEAFSLVNKSILTVEGLIARWQSLIKDKRTKIEGDVVTVNTNAVPDYFSEEQVLNAGSLNMNWNVNLLLLFHRQGYIDLQNVNYSPRDKAYIFKFLLKDLSLLNDINKHLEDISNVREKEFKLRTVGYENMRDLIFKPNERCWGKRFSEIYSLTFPFCNGCPAHSFARKNIDEYVKIRNSFEIDNLETNVNKQLKRQMGFQKTILVPIDANSIVDIDNIINKLAKFELSSIIIPKDIIPSVTSDSMILTHEEFCEISDKASWLFANGIAIVFGNDKYTNNKLYEASYSKGMKQYYKILFCSENMYIYSEGREIQDFLECKYELLEQL